MGGALGWGTLAASSLVLGALLGLVRAWPSRVIGLVLAFGAGALISAVSFELAAEGLKVADPLPVALGLALGALTYFVCDRLIEPPRRRRRTTASARRASGTGTALALGALLDGIPEQLVLGIGLTGGEGVSIGLLVAIYVSNLPEAIGSANEMHTAGHSRGRISSLWLAVAALCTLATGAGYAIAEATAGNFKGGVNGFAAGALLVMLVDSMIPDATSKAGPVAGLATTLGFALATGLSTLTA
jgi:zinc transporter, ZIP family